MNLPIKNNLVTKTLSQAFSDLDLDPSQISKILRTTKAKASQILDRATSLDHDEAKNALTFLRLYQSLMTLVEEDTKAAKAWLFVKSRIFVVAGTEPISPFERMCTRDGLAFVQNHLEYCEHLALRRSVSDEVGV